MQITSIPNLVSISLVVGVATCSPLPIEGEHVLTTPLNGEVLVKRTFTSQNIRERTRSRNRNVIDSNSMNEQGQRFSSELDSRQSRQQSRGANQVRNQPTNLQLANHHEGQMYKYVEADDALHQALYKQVVGAAGKVVHHGKEAAKYGKAAITGTSSGQEPINRLDATKEALSHALGSTAYTALTVGGAVGGMGAASTSSLVYGVPIVGHGVKSFAHKAMHHLEGAPSEEYVRDPYRKEKKH